MSEYTFINTIELALTLFFTAISLILGIFMILRYFKYKKSELLYVGATWCLVTSVFWADIITMFGRILFNTPLSDFYYFLITVGLLPVAHVTWMKAISQFFFTGTKQKVVFLIFVIEAIVFEILFLFLLIIVPSSIGVTVPMSHIEWGAFTIFYFIFSLLLFLITGLIFTFRSIRADKGEIRLKGRFLLIAFITFAIGIGIEILPFVFFFKYVVSRLIILLSSITFYIGFILPERIKKLFLK